MKYLFQIYIYLLFFEKLISSIVIEQSFLISL